MDGTLTRPNLDFAEMYRRCNVDRKCDILKEIASMPPAEQTAAQAVVDEMEAEGRRTLQLMPGAAELAGWLQRHGIPMALVTRNTAATVDHLHTALWTPQGLTAFEPAISRDDATLPAKPDPAALSAIAAAWDVPLGPEVLMVGDSPSNDVGFGKAAGVSTALLDSGRRVLEGGDSGGADLVVDALSRLPHRLFQAFEIRSEAAAPLGKYPKPSPISAACMAAAAGDCAALSRLTPQELTAIDPETGNSPLIWAADAGHADAVEVLLSQGADPNQRGYLGATAVARACRAGHVGVLQQLLAAAGVDPNLANEKMQTPLHFAAFKRKPEAVALMLAHPACNPFVLDRKGRTPAEDTSDDAIRAAIVAAQEAVLSSAM